MSGISLVLVIGLLNLLLGYAMAVRLGYGPTNLEEARPAISVEAPRDEPAEKPDDSVEVPLDDLIHELISGTGDAAASAWDEEPDGRPADLLDGEPAGKAEPPFGVDEDTIAGKLLAMARRTEDHLAWLVDLDTRLRRSPGEYELFTLLAWMQEIKEGCQRQRDEQQTAAGAFGGGLETLVELGAAGPTLAAAVGEQSARLDAAAAHPDQVDMKSDLHVEAARLVGEIDRVQNAAHRLRDCLDEAFLAVARAEGRVGAIEEWLRFDPLTKLPNRIGLETVLLEWQQEGGQQARPLSAALFDLDNFAEVNETHGLQACDGIVRATAECIGGLVEENEILARYGGKRLVLVMFDVGGPAAADRAELVRRSIDKTCFSNGEAEIHITLSGGVAAALARETPEHLLRRLEDALSAAKRSGRNCSFAHDGRRAGLVDPAELQVEPREVFV